MPSPSPIVAHARTLYREFRHPDAASPLVIEGVLSQQLIPTAEFEDFAAEIRAAFKSVR